MQLFFDAVQSGLVPVRPLRRERDAFGDEFIVVRVTRTRGAWPKGHESWVQELVVKAGRRGVHQMVRSATREEIDAAM